MVNDDRARIAEVSESPTHLVDKAPERRAGQRAAWYADKDGHGRSRSTYDREPMWHERIVADPRRRRIVVAQKHRHNWHFDPTGESKKTPMKRTKASTDGTCCPFRKPKHAHTLAERGARRAEHRRPARYVAALHKHAPHRLAKRADERPASDLLLGDRGDREEGGHHERIDPAHVVGHDNVGLVEKRAVLRDLHAVAGEASGADLLKRAAPGAPALLPCADAHRVGSSRCEREQARANMRVASDGHAAIPVRTPGAAWSIKPKRHHRLAIRSIEDRSSLLTMRASPLP